MTHRVLAAIGFAASLAAPAAAGDLRIVHQEVRASGAPTFATPGSNLDGVTLIASARVEWTGAWRTERNHDAAWLFVKLAGRGPDGDARISRHARVVDVLAVEPVDPDGPRGEATVAADGTGVFVSLAEAHQGDAAFLVELELDSSILGEMRAAEGVVHAVEMVYVPEGPFSVGDADENAKAYAAYYESDADGDWAGPFEIASEAGFDVGPVPCAFDFERIREELADAFPYRQTTRGDYLYGLNNGAKHSIDRVGYLTMAEATGMVTVQPQHQVVEVGARDDGGYYAVAELIDENLQVMGIVRYEADLLFMAAGSMNTTKLLLRAQRDGTLSSLNDQIGKNWGNNGQRILARHMITEDTGAEQGGPACILISDPDGPDGPIGMEFGPAPIGFECNCLVSATQGVPDQLGELALDEDGEVTPVWDRAYDAQAGIAARNTLQRVVDASEGVVGDLPGLSSDPSITFHPLGGATLGAATDLYGRVQGYEHLYVVDGALIPGSTPGGNPFWTISAVAERCLDRIIEEDLNP